MKYFLSLLSLLVFSVRMSGQAIVANGPTTFCAGANVSLSVNPNNGVTGYQWIKDGTNIPTATNATYVAAASGKYSVKLDRGALSDTTIGQVTITVNASPVINVNSAGICINQSSATLTATGALNYSWTPNSGLSSNSGSVVTANPAITTTYTVTGTNALGCSGTATSTVTVNPLPTANFTFAPNSQCSNVPVTFTNTSTGGSTYTWDFADVNSGTSNVSTAQNPTHTFVGTPGNASQNFAVVQTVTTAAGCTSTKTLNVTTKQQPDGTLGGTGRVIYNGTIYFKTCGTTNGDFTFTNQSTTQGTNTNYKIVWGDGSPDFNATGFVSTTHTYGVGSHALLFIVSGNNGCIDTTRYAAFVGTNPAVGLNNPGNTLACSGTSLTFPITGTATNAPGTVYTVTFNDGTPAILYTHPAIPSSITHVFNTTSCNTTSSNGTNTYTNSFSANIVAENPCASSAATVVPIYISKKPKAEFTIDPNDTVCVNSLVTLTNTSASNFVDNGICLTGNSIWSITPATGWSISSGSLGNDFGLTDPSVWQTGSQVLILNFSVPGTYAVKIKTGNTNCGLDEITKNICVTTPPVPSFTLSNSSGCSPLNVTTTNTTSSLNSCSAPTYQWTVSYTPAFCGTVSSWNYAGGSSASSANPSFNFTGAGSYTVTLSVTNACGTFPISKTVDVKQPSTVAITPPTYPCGPVTITPQAIITACGNGATTYSWTFNGGTPATSSALNPGPVTFSTPGVHQISLAVTNECGTVTDTETVTVTAAPDVVKPADQSLCGGVATTAVNFSSTVGTPVYNWTNNNTSIGLASSGTGNIPSFTTINAGSNPVTALITVTPFVNSNCLGIPVTFSITVNPRPAAPLVSSPVIYCLNATATPLSATAASGNTLTWYNNSALTGGTPTAPVPSTNANSTYYVTQTNGFNCASAATSINITVNPSITGNTIISDQNICANTIPNSLSSAPVSGGSGSYIFQWQQSTDGGVTWTNIPGAGASVYAPPALTATTNYRRVITSLPCSDTSKMVTITVQGALDNFDISANQTICAGEIPALLTGELPTGGGGSYTYLWESSTDNMIWTATGTVGQDYQPGILNQATYFRRKLFALRCDAISSTVIVTVNPTPKGIIAALNPAICAYDAASVTFTATAGTAPFAIELKVTRPGNTDTTILQTLNNNGPANIGVIAANGQPGTYTISITKITDANNCVNTNAPISSVDIIVYPKPVLVLNAPQPICSGTNTTLTASGASTYLWSPATGLSGTSGNNIVASPAVTTTYTVTGTQNNCVATGSVTVTVTPGTSIANAGPNQILCSPGAVSLSANVPAIGTGSWSQIAGPVVTITDPSLSNTGVTGLSAGERYIFEWTITGVVPCPPSFSNDTIDVLSPMINAIGNDTIICAGQVASLQTLALSGGNTTGLNASYSYQWEAATPGQSNWQLVGGATLETLSISPAVSTCYRRKVKSNNSCEVTSNTICVTVNPAIGNNSIGTTGQVCVNVLPANIIGAIPTGGDNNYAYQWQTSLDGINWINTVNTQNFQPALYTNAGLHYFRRNVTSGNCTASSNVITLTVRPDSKAIFTASPTIACSPFDLATAIVVQPLPDSNGTYQWFADGVLFGSNTTGVFPGYTILNSADTVLIKLITTSQFGCKPDSIEQQFVTVITAQAKFMKDTSFGCGPLPVNFTNVSSILNNSIQYSWDFGNGSTSNQLQPGVIVFNSSPFFNDTTYYISLKAYNGCDATTWIDSVKVRANPKARFGVDTTFGCSPFTIQINNTSPGGPNTYYWDFGNGVKDTTNSNGIFNYTYNIGNAVDTFTIRLIAENQCGRDTQSLNVRVAPNNIKPLINVNSSQLFGCAPHIVSFNNNSSGATGYTWNFGDNTPPVITNNNQPTVVHTYNTVGVYTVSIDITNGCSDTTIFRQVTVYARPIATFTTDAAIYCEGDTVRVTNNSQNATNYRWFWGDGSNSSLTNPTHVFKVAGNYNIFLRAERTNSSGLVCLDTVVVPITVLAKPVVTVQSNINAINCAPFTLNLTAPAIINETVTWYVYDSTVSQTPILLSGSIAQYIFNKPGSFRVKMIAVNAAGCNDSSSFSFTVRGKAVASFTPGDLSICTRDTTITFINTTTYNGTDPISYRWSVDNAFLSTGGNFTHRFNVLPAAILPRVFTTRLVGSNTVGCSDTAVQTISMNPLANAQFSITNPNDCVPYAPAIVNASTNTTSFKWLVNGTLVSTGANPVIVLTQGSTPYAITLVADNIYGCKPDTFTVNLISRARPNAIFKLSDTLGCTGNLNVATTNLTTGASSYTWNWGDNSTNNVFKNPTHLYTTQGQYLITLVASDGVCTDTTEQLVKVSVKPTVDFAVDQTLTCDTARVQFTNLTQNGSNYVWSFGDGTTSTDTNPFKLYPPRNSAYSVKLVATSTFSCRDSAVKANLVLAKVPPAADFFISPSPVITVPNYTFSFNNLTLNSPNNKYLWSLGDGSFATSRDVTRKYTDTGNYPIRLIVLDTVSNCPDTTMRIARIDGFPGYLYVPNAICPACIQTNLRDFLPKGMGLKEYRLQIFTTWGELVFETRTLDSKGAPTQAWDGKFKGTIVQQDVYVWRIDAKFLNGSEWLGMIYPGDSKYKKVGTITVVK